VFVGAMLLLVKRRMIKEVYSKLSATMLRGPYLLDKRKTLVDDEACLF
jgi:hypothetical protein